MFDAIQAIDFQVLDFIREWIVCPALDVVMKFFTDVGNAGIIWIVTALSLLCSKKHRRIGIVLSIGLVLMLLTGNILLKNLIARPRPFVADPTVELVISPPSGYSFPSGHSFSSAVSATILSLYSRKFAAAAIPTAFLIAFSRLYFYVHFPTDVLCGLVFGVILGMAVYMGCKKKILFCNSGEGIV